MSDALDSLARIDKILFENTNESVITINEHVLLIGCIRDELEANTRYKAALETIVCDREVLGAEGIYEVALNSLKGQNDE